MQLETGEHTSKKWKTKKIKDAENKRKVGIMTQSQFIYECTSRTIDPMLALENEDIRAALMDRDCKRVIELLEEGF